MGVTCNITNHTKLYVNDKGEEVYPPGHPLKGMVKPEGERQRNPNATPKSLAEERMEVEAERARKLAELSTEDRAALERLKKAGVV